MKTAAECTEFSCAIPFTKMQGLGNDYVYVEECDAPLPCPEKLSRAISHRHFGVGADGLVLIGPSSIADFRMRIFNADGSEAEMCGNASRCVGKYLYDHKLTQKHEIALETKSGIRALSLHLKHGVVDAVCVDMGQPRLKPEDIPMSAQGESFINQELFVQGKSWRGTAVSTGNPHLVIETQNLDALDLAAIGPQFEHHALFPARVNTEFVEIVNEKHIRMRVWERGSGETMACGTGACAALVACVLNGRTAKKADVSLPGGDLCIEWHDSGTVYMTGPAKEVFSGIYQFEER